MGTIRTSANLRSRVVLQYAFRSLLPIQPSLSPPCFRRMPSLIVCFPSMREKHGGFTHNAMQNDAKEPFVVLVLLFHWKWSGRLQLCRFDSTAVCHSHSITRLPSSSFPLLPVCFRFVLYLWRLSQFPLCSWIPFKTLLTFLRVFTDSTDEKQ